VAGSGHGVIECCGCGGCGGCGDWAVVSCCIMLMAPVVLDVVLWCLKVGWVVEHCLTRGHGGMP